ncbi:unnamed protein product [Ceratitis capitata]|uniref:(Mediterranean fruit fly) hypothetical protein n=1 Tax=Ceratitis capitata TaxID=7213 RepID=A0A811TZW4_CERCA|nr:unnamed protein product [Ceratitis capitata]
MITCEWPRWCYELYDIALKIFYKERHSRGAGEEQRPLGVADHADHASGGGVFEQSTKRVWTSKCPLLKLRVDFYASHVHKYGRSALEKPVVRRVVKKLRGDSRT